MLYYFGRFVFKIYMSLFYRLKVSGLKNLPQRKPFIICSNHINWLDPVTIGTAIPARYKINYMAKAELFKNPLFGYLLRRVGAFPIKRYEDDYAALKKSFKVLKEGHVLGLFPEGSRSKDGRLQKAHDGAALIAVRSGVPILPVAIKGPYRLFKPLYFSIGRPFVLPPLVFEKREDKRQQLEDLSRQIMHQIGRLLPQEGGPA